MPHLTCFRILISEKSSNFSVLKSLFYIIKMAFEPVIFGEHLIDVNAIEQIKRCIFQADDRAVLTADAHYGYGHPIGGVVGYKNKIR